MINGGAAKCTHDNNKHRMAGFRFRDKQEGVRTAVSLCFYIKNSTNGKIIT